MKINKISSEKITYFAPKTTPKNQTNIIHNSENYPKIDDLKYYQAINSLYFTGNAKFLAYPVKNKENKTTSIKVYIPLENKDSTTFEFDEAPSIRLLTKETGAIDILAMGIFVELFSDYYKIAKKKFEDEKAFLTTILQDKNEVCILNAKENTNEAFKKTAESQEEDYLQTLFNNIQDTRYKKELANVYLELINEKIAQTAMKCAKEALMVLKLSKKDYSIDMTNLDIKRDIAVNCVDYSKFIGYNCSELIIENSKDEKGNINLDFALKLAQTLQETKPTQHPKENIPILAKLLKQSVL